MAPFPAVLFSSGKKKEDAAGNSSGLSAERWNAELANSSRLILQGFVLPCAVFYAGMVVVHAISEPFDHFLALGICSALVALYGLFITVKLAKPGVSLPRLEFFALTYYLLVYLNILLYHMHHLEVSKLAFFALLALGVAATGVSLRVIIPMVALCLGTAVWMSSLAGYEAMHDYLFVVVAGGLAAVALTMLLRSTIGREVRARLEAEKLQESATRAASTDFLTGLPNRRRFFGRIEQIFSRPSSENPLVLALIDLNGFKHVNDLYGHVFGDQLLASVGQRIAEVCSETDQAARLGGDEFAILIEKTLSDSVLERFGIAICEAIGKSYEIAGTEITISATVGFARRLASTVTPAHLYEQADYALYQAKQSSTTGVEIFSTQDAADLDNLKKIEHQLAGSNLEREMRIEYQPIVSVHDNRVVGFEGLARWFNPELGNVRPDVFIRAAERRGIIGRLTPILLKKALADARSWPAELRLSFNLSARDVVSEDAINQICRIVEDSGVPGHRIDFEITETSIMTDFERVRDSLTRLRGLGARIALDDFGVGYSNFQHLDELMIDKVKIDRKFVSTIQTRESSARIVKTMIDMCANLGLGCVVEGIETEAELDAVLRAGATMVQGYLFSRPMTSDNVVPFLSHNPKQRHEPLLRSA